jgi:ABC-type molybdate transport system permease subunit
MQNNNETLSSHLFFNFNIMKKNKILFLTLLILIFSFFVSFASSQISQTELDIQIKAGNVLSD